MKRLGRKLEGVGHEARADAPRRRFHRSRGRRRAKALAGLGGRLMRSAAFASVFFAGGFCATLFWESQNGRPQSLRSARGYFANCREAREAGAAPLYQGQPGYAPWLDADHDGVACEPYRDS